MITATLILAARSRSISAAGTGTMITSTLATIPIGKIRSGKRARAEPRPLPDVAPGGIGHLRSSGGGRNEMYGRVGRRSRRGAEITQKAPQCPGRLWGQRGMVLAAGR